MNESVRLLQKHFDTALESPDGIKKLRELILTLAIQGKLVKQDPSDQPACELLKEIQAEKERLIAEGKIKQQKDLPPVSPEEVPYEVPDRWVWVRVGDIISIKHGYAFSSTFFRETVSAFVLMTPGNFFETGGFRVRGDRTKYYDGPVPNDFILKPHELIIAMTEQAAGLLGSAAFIPDDGNKYLHSQRLGKLIFSNNIVSPAYIYWFFNCAYLRNAVSNSSTGMKVKHTSPDKIAMILLPLPPLAVQKRIGAKINELMALCDKLEEQRKTRSEKRQEVHKAAINRLLNASDKNEFDSSWGFITRNFDRLYCVQENVAELKKAILTLAMQGKLVKQDPSDQPAGELLKEIQVEKERLITEGKIKRQKELLPVKPEEMPYEVPQGWVWTKLGEIGETNIGLTYSPTNISDNGIPVLRSSNVQKGMLDFDDIVRVQMDVKESAMVKEGDLLICARNGSKTLVGKTAMITGLHEPMAFGAFMAIFRSRFNNYILRYINSPLFRRMIDEVNTMTINQITQENLKNTAFPLPPLVEQKRIVAKIDDLMALCDKLQNQIEQATAQQTALFDAVLAKV